MERPQYDRAGWIGIPSVPPQRIGQALVLYYLAMPATVLLDALVIIHNHQPETWQLTVEQVFDDGGSILIWSLAATWPIMEMMRMVLAGIWEARMRRRTREEVNRRWREWLRRRDEAVARGEPFTEPAPDEEDNGRQS